MAYIRAKRRGNKIYYYMVDSHREGKKVRQKVLKYLGTQPPEGYQPKSKGAK